MRTIMSTGILSLVALLGGAWQADAQLIIISNYGAKCTFSTDGQRFGDIVLTNPLSDPKTGGVSFVHNWPDHFGETITATCSKEGFETKTITFSKVPTHWISTGAPCGVETNRPIEPQVTYCLNYDQVHKMDNAGPPVMWFPRMIVRLDPKPDKQ